MTREENKAYMKNFFEKYYDKRRKQNEMCVMGVDIPTEMLEEGADTNEEWNVWKLYPITIVEKEFEKYETEMGVKLPECIKAFFSTYHHRFDDALGRNNIGESLNGLYHSYNPLLVASGYLPFGWDNEQYFIRCIDLSNMPEEENCPIVQIDHEILCNLEYDAENQGQSVSKDDIVEELDQIADNFYEYLEGLYDGTIE